MNDWDRCVKAIVQEWSRLINQYLEDSCGSDLYTHGYKLILSTDIHNIQWDGRMWTLPGTDYRWRSRRVARSSIKALAGIMQIDFSFSPEKPAEYIEISGQLNNSELQ